MPFYDCGAAPSKYNLLDQNGLGVCYSSSVECSEWYGQGVTEQVWTEKTVSKIGETTLDHIHQSMIFFAASRSEALKRFLVDDGAGREQKFWRLAQALSALYPPKSDEKRWVDGVLARKKGLGF